MNPSQQLYSLFLQSLPHVGPVAIKQLLCQYASAEAFWNAPSAPVLVNARSKINVVLASAWRAGESGPHWRQAKVSQARLEEQAVQLVSWRDDAYPPLLKQTPDCPALLYVRGDLACLSQPQLAIVGSRHASRAGLATANEFAEGLSTAGLVVCSGLALGVDGAAHRGALKARGATTAVLGSGITTIYPRRHAQLADEICEHGALISEFPLNTPPRPGHFPRRNRIIAGMCAGTLVVEAAMRSGSLITARLALDYNREVFAVPGSIHNPCCKGNHALIRQGAKLVETTTHVLEEITSLLCCHSVSPEATAQQSVKAKALPSDGMARRVLAAVDEQPTSLDLIVDRTGMSAEELAETLLELELSGWVELSTGGWQRVLATGT